MQVKRCWVEVRGAERAELEQWLRAQSIPQALATRARVVLGSAAGESVRGLAARLGVTQTTVCLWRRRYRSEVDWDVVDRMLDFGGIRIEDNVLITDAGHEVITDVPLLG